MADNKQRCGAKCRDGSRCKSWAMDNGRCRMHGGKSLKGKDSRTWKSGIYSRYASKSLKDVLDQLQELPSEDLLNADNELKLLQALIIESKALKNGTGDIDELDTLSRVIERLLKAKLKAIELKQQEERLVPAEDVKLFLSFCESLLISRMDETEAYELIEEMQAFRISDHATG